MHTAIQRTTDKVKSLKLMSTGLLLGALITTPNLHAQWYASEKEYKVTITNISQNIRLTPILVATHDNNIQIFEVGSPANEGVIEIAEGGNIAPLKTVLDSSQHVHATQSSQGLLMPGASTTIDITSTYQRYYPGKLSLISMLLPTNDTFMGLNGVTLPRKGSVTYMVNAYDAGSELNDEYCANIPGPTCGGEGYSPSSDGEGYIYPAPTTHGEADLSRSEFGWDGPVAKVTITRMK